MLPDTNMSRADEGKRRTQVDVALEKAMSALHARCNNIAQVEMLVRPRVDKPLLIVPKPHSLNIVECKDMATMTGFHCSPVPVILSLGQGAHQCLPVTLEGIPQLSRRSSSGSRSIFEERPASCLDVLIDVPRAQEMLRGWKDNGDGIHQGKVSICHHNLGLVGAASDGAQLLKCPTEIRLL